MTKSEDCGIGVGNAYEAAFISVKTGITPRLVPMGRKMLEFRFPSAPEVYQASRDFNEGGEVEGRLMAQVARGYFDAMRAFDWTACTPQVTR